MQGGAAGAFERTAKERHFERYRCATLLHRDEYQFIMSPLLLGSGRPLFSAAPNSLRLALRESKAYKSGNVKLVYGRQEQT